MKNLAYSSALLSAFLLVASCTKNDLVKPGETNSIPQTVQSQSPCSSPGVVKYVLSNDTKKGSFNVAFSGPGYYSFILPANGNDTVTIPSGVYTLKMSAIADNDLHSFLLGSQPPVNASSAVFTDLVIDPCHTSGQLQVSIK
jgi:hypothetical protein